jgi:hypothetical protein
LVAHDGPDDGVHESRNIAAVAVEETHDVGVPANAAQAYRAGAAVATLRLWDDAGASLGGSPSRRIRRPIIDHDDLIDALGQNLAHNASNGLLFVEAWDHNADNWVALGKSHELIIQ